MAANVSVDRVAPLRFLRTAFEPDDWVAVFLKSYETGQVAQRVGPRSLIASRRFQGWLRWRNLLHWNVYVSVNAIAPHRHRRTRDAIRAIRHVFVEADRDANRVLERIAARSDLPRPSYVLHSSPGRVHIFWRVVGFAVDTVERLQNHLAADLGTDPAATPSTQTTRIPGFFNHKRTLPHLVTIEYWDATRSYGPDHFPKVQARSVPSVRRVLRTPATTAFERAHRYIQAVPPAISGQHGDMRTFQICCRLVRGFGLSDDQSMELLSNWNARCEPPWSEAELKDKLQRAHRYGREPIGGLLDGDSRFDRRDIPKAR
jgi:hypothetical protein